MTEGKAPLPPRWFIKTFWHVHRRVVRASGGRKGLWVPRRDKWGALQLATTGRRSGQTCTLSPGVPIATSRDRVFDVAMTASESRSAS